MSIANQITRINTAKADIKEVVNQDFEKIQDETITYYPDKIAETIEEYKKYIPEKSYSGTEINVDDAIPLRVPMIPKANTYQKQLSGKNLWGRFSFTRTMSGVTHQQNADGSIIVNGSTTNAKSYSMMSQDAVTNERIITLPAGDYTLSGASANVKLQFVKRDGTALFSTNSSYSFTLTEETQGFVRTYVMENTVVNNETLYIQLEQGSTATDWEPYCGGQPSPNPDYPQEIKVVTGDNVVKQTGKNKFCAELSSLWYASETGKFFNFSNYTSLICRVEPNTEYTISKKNMSNRFVLITSETKPQHASTFLRILIAATNSPRTQFTFTTTSNEKYIFFGVYSGSNETEIAKAIEEIQLEEGSNPTQYEPYKEKDYKLNLGTIELCKIDNYQDTIFKNVVGDENYNAELENGAWYKKKVINKIKLNYSDFTNIQSINPNGYVNFRFSNLNVNDWSQDNLARAKSLCNFSIYDNTGIANVNKEGFMLADGKTLYLRISQNRFSTVERLKEFLDENDLYFYYIMKNIAYEKITDTTLISQLEALNKARWFKGVNHWWTETDNLDPVLAGTYKQSIQSETQNSIANLQVQANEQSISNTPDLVESEV